VDLLNKKRRFQTMQKRSLKIYVATLIFTLSLASFALAGEGQCPIAPPPPHDEDGRGNAVNANPDITSDYQVLKGIWEFLTQNTDLF
jgi:hypothetical protein